MRIWKSEAEFDLPSCVLALGTFDGVHKGHQALIRSAMDLARQAGTACVVYTFDRHPLSVICPDRAPQPLLTQVEKLDKLEQLGVDGVLLQSFNRDFAALEAAAYLENLAGNLHARGIVAGFNYTFGAGGRGNADLIRSQADRLGYRAVIVDAVMDEGDVVSSTLLRKLRADGEMDRFLRLLNL